MRPNFLLIGAEKCGTSTLSHLLVRHPDVFMCDPREVYFFCYDAVWARGWAWYESLFAEAGAARAVGDGTTDYTMVGQYPATAGRIAEHLPDARLIYIVRDPLTRIESNWMHLRSRENRETLPFNQAVRERPLYIDTSSYLKQIDVYRAHYPDDRILVLFLSDLKADPDAVLRRCFAFLDVDPDAPIETDASPRHVSSTFRVDGPLTGIARRIPFFRQIRDHAPTGIRDTLRRLLKPPIGERPEWDDATRAWVIEQLIDDSRAFLERYGKPPTHWAWVAEHG